MRPENNIEKSIKNNRLQLTSSSEMDKRILDDILAVLEETKKTKPAGIRPDIWRTIMKSKLTKYAAVAVIIIGVIIGINYFGGSIDGSNVAWGEVAQRVEKAINNTPWIHMIMKRTMDKNEWGFGEWRKETWINVESGIKAVNTMDFDGPTYFIKDNKKYEYCCKGRSRDPQCPADGRITVSDHYDDKLSGVSLKALLPQLLKESGAIKWTIARGKHDGVDVDIYKAELPKEAFADIPQVVGGNGKLLVNSNTQLLIYAKWQGYSSDGLVLLEGSLTFDYPKNGPTNIYDLGVPESAEIVEKSSIN